MRERIKLLILTLGSVFAFTAPAVLVHGAVQDKVCEGIEKTEGTTSANDCDNDQEGEDRVIGIIRTVINVLSLLVGSICVIMIIVGGFRYLISGGDSNGVTAAKNTIIYAIVGLVIVLLAQALVRFVFSRTTSTE